MTVAALCNIGTPWYSVQVATDLTVHLELPGQCIEHRPNSMQFVSREGKERDIVEAMLYLTSPRSRFAIAETLSVTGGFAAELALVRL